MKHHVEMRFLSLLDETVLVDFTPAVLGILWERVTTSVNVGTGKVKMSTRYGDVARTCARLLFETDAPADASHLVIDASKKCPGCVVAASGGGVMHIGYCGMLLGTQSKDTNGMWREDVVAHA